jgi:DNA-binding Lrp family transcriptional regulator
MIDEIDKKIISELQEDGRKSLSSIGKKIGCSSVATWKRLQKLTKGKWIKISANVNVKKLFPKIAIIEAEVKDYATINKLILKYKDCPRSILTSSSGGSNIITILVGENLPTLESVIGCCSVRIEEGVRRSEVRIIENLSSPHFLPIKPEPLLVKSDAINAKVIRKKGV